MTTFDLTLTPTEARLALPEVLTIELATPLHTALQPALAAPRDLLVDASALTRTDAAILQVLWAAARAAATARLVGASPAWTAAWDRHGLPDPFQLN